MQETLTETLAKHTVEIGNWTKFQYSRTFKTSKKPKLE